MGSPKHNMGLRLPDLFSEPCPGLAGEDARPLRGEMVGRRHGESGGRGPPFLSPGRISFLLAKVRQEQVGDFFVE